MRSLKEIKDKVQYTDYMVFAQLARGDSFGGRVLAPYDFYSQMRRLYFGNAAVERYYPAGCNRAAIDAEPDLDYHTKSLLSVVADTAKVEAWVIDKSDMAYLDDRVLRHVYGKIILNKDEDRPHSEQDIHFIIEQFQKWDRYKVSTVDSLFHRKAMLKYFSGK